MSEIIQNIEVELDPVTPEIEIELMESIATERDYNRLENKPQINGHILMGNLTHKELDIPESEELTNLEIEALLSNIQ